MLDWFGYINPEFQPMRLEKLLTKKIKQTGDSTLTPLSLSFGKVVVKKMDIPEETLLSYQKVMPGDLVINPLNLNFDLKSFRVGLSELHGCLSSGYIVAEINKNINKTYFNYLMHIYDVLELKNLGGGVRQTVSFEHLKKEYVAIPANSVQTAIANYLDHETARIDAEIKKEERRIELLEELLQATIFEAVTKGIDANAEMVDSGIEWVGKIPKGYKLDRLKNIFCEHYTKNGEVLTKEYPVLSLSYGVLKKRNLTGNTGLLPESFNTYNKLDPGLIVFRLTDLQNDKTSLRVAIGDKKGLISPAYLALKPKIKCDYRFYAYFFKAYDSSKQIYELGSGVRQSGTWKDMKNNLLPIIPIKEQSDISNYLDAETERIRHKSSLSRKKIELLKELKQATIYEAVTGKTEIPSKFYSQC